MFQAAKKAWHEGQTGGSDKGRKEGKARFFPIRIRLRKKWKILTHMRYDAKHAKETMKKSRDGFERKPLLLLAFLCALCACALRVLVRQA